MVRTPISSRRTLSKIDGVTREREQKRSSPSFRQFHFFSDQNGKRDPSAISDSWTPPHSLELAHISSHCNIGKKEEKRAKKQHLGHNAQQLSLKLVIIVSPKWEVYYKYLPFS